MRRFSNTVIFGKTSRPSGESVSPLLTSLFVTRPCISSPFRSILPERGCKSPMIVRKSVLLPAPLLPISATISPLAISRSTSQSACRFP